MLDVVILENMLSISTDLRTNSWEYITLLVGYKFTTAHVRDSVYANDNRFIRELLKGLRLVMWSLLHDTDQLREILSTDQSLRDRRSRGLWSVLSLSRG